MSTHKPVVLTVVLTLVLAGIGACAARSAQPTPTPSETPDTALPATEVAHMTPTVVLPTSTATSQAGETCTDCHTDAETLKALAQDEAPTESLSSGEG